jgi:hypothetical protein
LGVERGSMVFCAEVESLCMNFAWDGCCRSKNGCLAGD